MDFFIIDASSFLYRSYYALPKLSTSKGSEVGALYGFTRLIVKILKRTSHIAVCYDSKRNIKKDIFSDYKANRKKIDDELIKQIEMSKETLCGLGIKYVEFEGYEADDIIASIVKKFYYNVDRIIITSLDKDLFQLINEKVFLWDGKSESYFDSNYVLEKYGVSPSSIRDLLVLCGDSSDNIAGVNGIGLKTAAKIISDYESVDKILSTPLSEKDSKYIRKIKESRDVIEKARILVSLKDDIDIDYSVEDFRVRMDKKSALEVLSKFEFRNIAADLGFKTEINEGFKELGKDEFLFLNPTYISVFENSVFFEDFKTEVSYVKELLFKDSIKKYLYNSKDIFFAIGSDDITNYEDIMIAYHIVWGALRKPDPYRMVEEVFGVRTEHPGFYFRRMMDDFLKKIDDFGMRELYLNEKELSKVLYRMEKEGVRIDVDLLVKLRDIYTQKANEMTLRFKDIAGIDINLNSPKQLSDFLFKKMNIKLDSDYERMFKTKGGRYSTSEDALKLIMPYNPHIISVILRFREYSKLASFVSKLLAEVKGGRIYTHFDQVTTSTGRLASHSPNLQNVPVKNEEAIKIRDAFIASEGFVFVSFDYSQIDLRVIANLSQDEVLVNAFKNNLDVHRITASSIFGVSYNDVTDDMRKIAKTVNFGIIYGLSPIGLSMELGIDRTTASEYIKRYFETYKGVKRWIDFTLDYARNNGYVVNFFGRRRIVPEISSKNRSLRSASERMAINMPVQSGSSDIIKKAMVNIYRYIKDKADIKLLLQIHDELLFEIKEDRVFEYEHEIKKIMENVFSFSIPLVVNVKKGKRWGGLK
ncbi:MAG: DNA polymerase [Elusimicrobiales bacterium]